MYMNLHALSEEVKALATIHVFINLNGYCDYIIVELAVVVAECKEEMCMYWNGKEKEKETV